MFSSHWKYVFSQLSGNEPRLPVLHSRERALGKWLHVDVPLVGQEGFDRHIRAVAVRHHVGVRLERVQEPRS